MQFAVTTGMMVKSSFFLGFVHIQWEGIDFRLGALWPAVGVCNDFPLSGMYVSKQYEEDSHMLDRQKGSAYIDILFSFGFPKTK